MEQEREKTWGREVALGTLCFFALLVAALYPLSFFTTPAMLQILSNLLMALGMPIIPACFAVFIHKRQLDSKN